MTLVALPTPHSLRGLLFSLQPPPPQLSLGLGPHFHAFSCSLVSKALSEERMGGLAYKRDPRGTG